MHALVFIGEISNGIDGLWVLGDVLLDDVEAFL